MAKGTLPHVEYSCKISRLGTFSFFSLCIIKCCQLLLLVLFFNVILIFFPLCKGDSNNATQVNESIDLLKLSLEKNDHGFIRLRDNKTTDVENEGTSAKRKTTNSSLPLATSATNIKDEAAIHMLLACKRNVILFYFYRTGVFSLAAESQQASEKQLGEF